MHEVTDGKTGHRLSKGMHQNPDGSSSHSMPSGKNFQGEHEHHSGVSTKKSDLHAKQSKTDKQFHSIPRHSRK